MDGYKVGNRMLWGLIVTSAISSLSGLAMAAALWQIRDTRTDREKTVDALMSSNSARITALESSSASQKRRNDYENSAFEMLYAADLAKSRKPKDLDWLKINVLSKPRMSR